MSKLRIGEFMESGEAQSQTLGRREGVPGIKKIEAPRVKITNMMEMTPEYLAGLDIPELYEIIHEHLDNAGMINKLRDNIGFRVALVNGWLDALAEFKKIPAGTDYVEVNRRIMNSEAGFINDLKKRGVHVEERSELSAERLAFKPHLFMATHQGGGLETYVLADMMRRAGVERFRYVMKDELAKLPLVGKVISARGPIWVSRDQLKDKKTHLMEVAKVANDIVEAMVDGESVLFFFEGTRSKSGAIAHTERRREWCYELNDAIELAAKKYPQLDYGKGLVVLDMLSVLPKAVEKSLLVNTRLNGDCTINILDADNLAIRENDEDTFDEKTLFGKARTVLKGTLIERIEWYQTKDKSNLITTL